MATRATRTDRKLEELTPLLAFYLGSHPDHRGRMLAEIIEQDDLWLEVTHDYIQWLFPITEFSRVVPGVPPLTRDDIRIFRGDPLLRQHVHAAFLRMLRFYGLAMTPEAISKRSNWSKRKTNWFTEPTHNSLRITRILKCLMLVGLEDQAILFHDCIERLRLSEPDCGVGQESFTFWRQAIAPETKRGRRRPP